MPQIVVENLTKTFQDPKRGTVNAVPYRGGNGLYQHGPLRIASNHRHFEHVDGTPFFWLADTWWMGLVKRLRWPEDFERLTAKLVNKPKLS